MYPHCENILTSKGRGRRSWRTLKIPLHPTSRSRKIPGFHFQKSRDPASACSPLLYWWFLWLLSIKMWLLSPQYLPLLTLVSCYLLTTDREAAPTPPSWPTNDQEVHNDFCHEQHRHQHCAAIRQNLKLFSVSSEFRNFSYFNPNHQKRFWSRARWQSFCHGSRWNGGDQCDSAQQRNSPLQPKYFSANTFNKYFEEKTGAAVEVLWVNPVQVRMIYSPPPCSCPELEI